MSKRNKQSNRPTRKAKGQTKFPNILTDIISGDEGNTRWTQMQTHERQDKKEQTAKCKKPRELVIHTLVKRGKKTK